MILKIIDWNKSRLKKMIFLESSKANSNQLLIMIKMMNLKGLVFLIKWQESLINWLSKTQKIKNQIQLNVGKRQSQNNKERWSDWKASEQNVH